MDDPALGGQAPRGRRQRADEVHLRLDRRVGLARRQHRLHRAPGAGVDEGQGEPPVHGAERVQKPSVGGAGEHGSPRLRLDQREGEHVADRRAGELAGQDPPQELEAGHPAQPVHRHDAGRLRRGPPRAVHYRPVPIRSRQ